MKITEIHYFAYGSNLCPQQIIARCPSARFVAAGMLPDHQLIFPRYSCNWKCGVAGIKKTSGECIEGAVYAMSVNCIERLDEHEGVHVGRYHREVMTITHRNGGESSCAIYIAAFEPDGHYPPSTEYLSAMLRGARHHGLSPQWIEKLETFHAKAQQATAKQ